MKFFRVTLALTLQAVTARADLSPGELSEIGRKVWHNECAGTVEGLTSWNVGEEFASLGIGHFIWYPEGRRGPFEESFPALVRFLETRGAHPPSWTHGACPWNSRAEFQREMHGERLQALRAFLAHTIPAQAEFLSWRMREALPKMLAQSRSPAEVRRRFERLQQSAHGTFALIDYVNFKGEGTLPTERYDGEGWGLLQVIEAMKEDGDPTANFSEAAKRVLARRVQNAPRARHEERWLPGWKNRVASYAGS